MSPNLVPLRRFSKGLCVLTFLLIFLGALVKSTESGLSVPDWPTTYGKFMFAFPLSQMVGGIKYEHTHRMLASIVGLFTLILCVWTWRSPVSLWIKRLSLVAFLTVIAQGILGGLTVKYFLPVWLSMMHGVLAQTFLLVVIMIAYSLSVEYQHRRHMHVKIEGKWLRAAVLLTGMVYVQLILGNWMRHTQSGLAVPDFPSMGWTFLPTMDDAMLHRINAWRFENNMDSVTMFQVCIHLLHRFWALLILVVLFYVNHYAIRKHLDSVFIMKTLFWINVTVGLQIMLGISTVLLKKEVVATTCHVTMGAIVLAFCFLLILRSGPCRWQEFVQNLKEKND